MRLIFYYQPEEPCSERSIFFPCDSSHAARGVFDKRNTRSPRSSFKKKYRFSFLICLLFSLFLNKGIGQTVSFTLDTIPYSDNDILAPFRGANTFYTYTQAINIPDPNTNVWSLDNETRFNWSDLQNGPSSYTWSNLDNQINTSIDKGQKFAFRVVTIANGGDGTISTGGGILGYPMFVHTGMQSESPKDWIPSGSGNMWVPNWNSNTFLSAWENFLKALADHINSGSYKGIAYKDVLSRFDICGFGNYGEWHNAGSGRGSEPSGCKATGASLIRIVAANIAAFPNVPLIGNVDMFYGENDAELGYYVLNASNNWGKIGFRNDHLGDAATFNAEINDPRSYNGLVFSKELVKRWQYAPIIGETLNSSSPVLSGGSCQFWDFENEVRTLHLNQYNNQNGTGVSSSCLQDNYRKASKASGYRLQVKSGSVTNTGSGVAVNLNWSNIGIAPVYENWDVWFELRDGSTVVWSGKSSFTPKLFLPGTQSVTDNFSVPVQGNFALYLIIKDPAKYRKPLPLTNKNRASDGSYLLTYVNVSASTNLAPVANAGTNQTITLPSNSVALDGTASKDPDGSITSYTWSKVSGPAQGSIANAAGASTSATNLVQGTYVFKITVTDNNNFTGSDSVVVTVNAVANQLPVANAGANQTITLPANSVTLDGSSSADPDGTISAYTWSKVSGPAQGTISNTSAASTSITNLAQGIYVFKLTVKDNGNATAADSVTITVNAAANKPPVANAGANQTITLPNNSVTLNGAASSDADGTITTYTWSKVSGPAQGSIANAAGTSTSATNLVQGTYVFKLIVKDNSNATAADSVIITVNAASNKPPVANAGANQTITLPNNSVTLNGAASSDADGTITSYTWSKISGPAQGSIANTTSSSTSATNLVQGTYVFKLIVKDNSNATSADSVIITVNAAINQPPSANAGVNQTITLPGNSVTLSGSASDGDGTITSYTWSKISGPAQGSIGNTTSASTPVTNLVQGTYVFRLTVKDNTNATAIDSVIITVNAAANQLPVANAGTNQTITLPANAVTLNGSASSDADGTITSYTWVKTAGPAAIISNADNSSTTVSNLQAGQYTFELTVTDNNGASDKATVKITVVNAADLNPVADAGNNRTITLPVNTITLNGGRSSDPDGNITSYSWTKISGPAQGAIANSNQSSATANNLVQGAYIFKLVVTDNNGNTGSDSVIITVNPAVNKLPVADAGSGQSIILPANSAILDGTESVDPDGTIVSYKWVKISGGAANIADADAASTTVSGLQAGQYIFELTVTDDKGAIAKARVRIVVNAAPNQPPVANAGPNKNIILPVNSVNLDGSASTDADGTIVSYSWAKIAGGTVTITGEATATPTVSGLQAGQYTFELTITDNRGASTKAQVKINVSVAPNQLPVANAGANQTITLPANSVILDGSLSSDPDGTIATYSWAKITGPAATIANANTATPTVSGLTVGQYTFELTVTDNKGGSTKAEVKVSVNAAPNQLPIANAGANQTLPASTVSVTLDGSKSGDPDGTIVTYNWTKIFGAEVTITNAGTAAPTVSGLQGGQYTFELTITDNKGATAKAQVKITVNLGSNQSPVANAGANQTINLPANSTKLDGSKSSDPDGTIASYSWMKIDGPSAITIINVNTATPTVSGLVAGQYTFELTVTDNRGVSTKAQVRVTVREAANQSPLADAGADQNITLPAKSIKLDGSKSSDPDGTLVSYSWMKIDGASAVTITNVNTATPAISGLKAGRYTFELTVTDNKGATAKDQVSILVNPASNQPPVADAGRNITILSPESTAVLDGSSSHDSQGNPLTYTWEQVQGPEASDLSAPTAQKITVSNLKLGEYLYKLTVTNSAGLSASAEVKVNVVHKETAAIELYPNPATDIINIKVVSDSVGTVAFNIYDLNGRSVKRIEMNKQIIDNLRLQIQRRPVNGNQGNTTQNYFSTPVNINQLSAGVYILETIIDSRIRVTSKFVKH
ncbi:MAG: PKD domain-containing protein [Bacteroidota bacterium]